MIDLGRRLSLSTEDYHAGKVPASVMGRQLQGATFAGKFPFPQCDRVETILEDSSIDAVAVLITQAIHSVWRDFLDAIQRGGEPGVYGEEALRVHRLIDALLEAAAKGAAVRFSPVGLGTR